MEIDYNGWRIVEAETNVESHGFKMGRVFKVLDEFDDPLPITHNAFWSPGDAMQAIDFVVSAEWKRKWPTTHTHEFNLAMAYRANFVNAYRVLQSIPKLMGDAAEFGDDPVKPVTDALDLLQLQCLAGKR